MTYKIGIDLGTTFSGISYIDEHGQATMIRDENGQTTIPSVIYFGEDTPLIGEGAKERQAFGDLEVASFFKRSMGEEGFIQYFNDKTYSATELSAVLLKHLKEIAQQHLQTEVTEAVITVPAYFENKQREETIKAGEQAGLKVKAIINEPTAAALAYGINQSIDQHLVVYDLGGGTFDVTVVEISAKQIRVLATGGDHLLGGKDWDDRIISYVAERFQEKHGIDPLDHFETVNELLTRAEQAKMTLSVRSKAHIPVICEGIRETFTITRDLFESLTKDLMERTWSLTERTLRDAHLSWRHISDVLLVGGSTRMPMVHDYIKQAIGKPPLKGVHPDEAVALGAAIRANLPEEKEETPQFTLGSAKEIVDVMSHSLGLVIMNENKTSYINSIILYKNEPIPINRKRTYQVQTAPGNRNVLEVYVTQGESDLPYECSIIGKYEVTGIKHQAGGQAAIDIDYAYDKNGVIQITAFDRMENMPLTVVRDEITGDLNWLKEPPKIEEVEEVADLSVVMAVDLSGSMSGDPLKESQKAALEFISKMDLSHTSVGLVGFANQVEVVSPLTDHPRALEESVHHLKRIFDRGNLGYGTSAEPFTAAKSLLEGRKGLRIIIVLTDGLWANQQRAINMAQEIEEDIEIIAIGFGQADRQFLEQIATTDENALFTDLSQLVSSFSRIAQELNETNSGQTKRKSGFLRIFK